MALNNFRGINSWKIIYIFIIIKKYHKIWIKIRRKEKGTRISLMENFGDWRWERKWFGVKLKSDLRLFFWWHNHRLGRLILKKIFVVFVSNWIFVFWLYFGVFDVRLNFPVFYRVYSCIFCNALITRLYWSNKMFYPNFYSIFRIVC